jgi:hypothetical protein
MEWRRMIWLIRRGLPFQPTTLLYDDGKGFIGCGVSIAFLRGALVILSYKYVSLKTWGDILFLMKLYMYLAALVKFSTNRDQALPPRATVLFPQPIAIVISYDSAEPRCSGKLPSFCLYV